jgi:3-isopropylmalate/(R)-2-methylmalate dehydratase small subunit
MEPFVTLTGRAVPLRRTNVDTDQIIPAVYLKRVTREGFGDGLFAAWREDPSFVLNQERYSGATILVAGTDFGTGSSREHAVWALLDYGFRAVIAPRFGDIFRNNATKAGLLPVVLPEKVVALIQDASEATPPAQVTVDLDAREVRAVGGGLAEDLVEPFQIDDYTRWRLMEGLDDIGLTLRHEDQISAFEATRPSFLPAVLPAAVLEASPRDGARGAADVTGGCRSRPASGGAPRRRPDPAPPRAEAIPAVLRPPCLGPCAPRTTPSPARGVPRQPADGRPAAL